MTGIKINASEPYEMLIAPGILRDTGRHIRKAGNYKTVALIADKNVDSLYGELVESSIESAGLRVLRYAFPGGEFGKTLETAEKILEFLAENGLTRSDCIAALGGGIAGDVSGFCAAIYQRGIDFVQLPTTLLAAVDSSVGGKTGVNLAAGKNLAGAFWQPRLVLCDTQRIRELPAAVLADGFAEVIKYGVLEDAELFAQLESGDWELDSVIARCVGIKAKYVAKDERDNGERQKLNLGHTFGHAIEKASNFAVSHGGGVAVGLVMAARAAELLGVAHESCFQRIACVAEKFGLPIETAYSATELFPAMTRDKKRSGDDITLILPERIGRCVAKKLPISELESLLREVAEWR